MNSTTEAVVNREIRRGTWVEIRKVLASSVTDTEKVAACLNLSNVYTAITGDDRLTPRILKKARKEMIDEIAVAMARGESVRKLEKSGMKAFI